MLGWKRIARFVLGRVPCFLLGLAAAADPQHWGQGSHDVDDHPLAAAAASSWMLAPSSFDTTNSSGGGFVGCWFCSWAGAFLSPWPGGRGGGGRGGGGFLVDAGPSSFDASSSAAGGAFLFPWTSGGGIGFTIQLGHLGRGTNINGGGLHVSLKGSRSGTTAGGGPLTGNSMIVSTNRCRCAALWEGEAIEALDPSLSA